METTALTCTFSYASVHSNNLGLRFLDVDSDDSRIVLLQYSPVIVDGLESPGPLQVMSGNLMKPGDILCSVVCNNTDVPFSLTDEGCLLVGENSAKHNVKLNFLRIRDTNSFQSPSDWLDDTYFFYEKCVWLKYVCGWHGAWERMCVCKISINTICKK